MAAPNPAPYERGYSFAGWQASHPDEPLPGQQVDIELDNLGVEVNRTIGALADIRRADGKLNNKVTTYDSLDDNLRRRLAVYGNDITVDAFNSVPEAKSVTIPEGTGSVFAQGFADAGDGGAALYRRVGSQPAHNAWWQDASGAYFELAEPYVNILQFGAVGDGVSDDWASIMAAIDYSVTTGLPLHAPKRNYGVTKPINLNGSAWVAGGKSVVGGQPGCKAFIGDSYGFFGSRFVALPGFSGEAVVFGRNLAGRDIHNIHVDGAGIANPIDVSWVGTASGVPGTAAPACQNSFTGWFAENCVAGGTGIRVDGAADTLLENLNYRGGTPSVGLSMSLPGGIIAAKDLHIYRGRIELACQNGRISDSFLANGLRLVGSSISVVSLDACQLSTDPESGYTVWSDTDPGSFGTHSIHFNACYFLGGVSHTYYFAGRWWMGCKFTACHFTQNTPTFFDTVTPGRWEANSGSAPPIFDFEHCSFHGGGSSFPVSVASKVLVGIYACKRPDSVMSNTRAFPADITLGGERITAGKFRATGEGIYFMDQAQAIVPANAYGGMGYNLSGSLGEIFVIQHGDVIRFIQPDGTVLWTFNVGAASGFYPGTDNTRNLGILSNRFKEAFIANGTINTSDAREKQDFRELSANEMAFAKALSKEVCIYKLKAAVEEEAAGGDPARFNIGMTVQRAIELAGEHSVSWALYDFMRHHTWVADEAASGTAGDRYGFKMDQLLALVVAGLEARLTELEGS